MGLVALVMLLSPGESAADPSTTERALATVLFNEGRSLMAEGKWADACPKLAESQRLDPGGGTLLNLAICHENEGKTATAWSELNDALALAIREQRVDREDIAREHIAAIEPRLARLQVRVPDDAAGYVEVLLDGVVWPRAAWGSAVPVNPGRHQLDARAGGRAPWAHVITASPGTLTHVDVPALGWIPVGAPPVAPAASAVPGPQTAVRDDGGRAARRTAGFVVGGVGVAVLAVGIGAGVMAIVEADEAAERCGEETSTCKTADDLAHSDRSETAATLANVAIAGGLIATAVGVVLVLTSWPRKGARPVAAPARSSVRFAF